MTTAATPEYKRLSGKGFRGVTFIAGTRADLWLGPDHLLVVDSSGYSETYKRFYFKDIQGIVMRPTIVGRVTNAVLGLPLVLLIIGALAAEQTEDMFLCLFFGAFFAIPLVVNLVKGATCQTELFTAVQSEELVSLHRVRLTRKVLAQLQPLIAAAQGELKPEEMAVMQSSLERPGADAGAFVTPAMPLPEVNYRSKVHLMLAWVALADVPMTVISLLMDGEFGMPIAFLHMLAIAILSIVAINVQRGTNLSKGLKRLPVYFLSSMAAMIVLRVCVGVYTLFNQSPDFEMVEGEKTASEVVIMLFLTALNALGGLYGIKAMKQYRESLAAAEVQTPPPPTTQTF
jgi:hypothetical protein